MIVLALIFVSMGALAQDVTGHFGNWMTYVTLLPQSQTRVCGMMYPIDVGGRQGSAKAMFIKIYDHSLAYPEGLATVELYKASWDFSKGSHPDVGITIDNAPLEHPDSAAHGSDIELKIPSQYLVPFLFSVTDGRYFIVKYPGMGEADWIISLIGSKEAVASLVMCARSQHR